MNGEFLLDEIDDFVDRWHDQTDGEAQLHEYLGMTWEEYSLWAGNPDCLSDIANARVRGIPLRQAINDNLEASMKLAARSDKASKIVKLQRWIEEQIKRDSQH